MKNLWYIAAGLLFIGALSMPSGYYDLLRWVIFGISAYAAYINFELNETSWVISFVIIGLIFNPFMPVYLYDKFLWLVIDIASGIIYLLNSKYIK
jgi:uncharacterized membrane protein